ncbi:MAG: DUF2283 domain-containing protein [Hyphomicrobiales bacterium]|nr:DUF2283 domain-containing protein [Hyphomicrobiales bacterium]
MTNRLYYGDNLAIPREHIADESVDLVYLDPPFNSNATYNVLFKAPDVVFDYDAQGRIVGIELLDATSQLPSDALTKAA